MGLLLLVMLACGSGFILFRRTALPAEPTFVSFGSRLSVIIPARNEERNLPHLLRSLQLQSCAPFEIIVVNDGSDDRTGDIARGYTGVSVVDNPEMPAGWTGKNWAVWNGYLHAAGDLLLFLDADVRLRPHALASMLHARKCAGGALTVVPYHDAERFYEKLALLFNVLGVFAFLSPFEQRNPRRGMYGSCILVTRKDYERTGGHREVRGEVLDDLNLGARFVDAGIPISTYIGYGAVSFRMYPGGIRSEIEGFAKGAVQSAAMLHPASIALIALWMIGLLASGCAVFLWGTPWGFSLALGYAAYTLQIVWFARFTGHFGFVLVVAYWIPALFFLYVMLYSMYQLFVLGRVIWKGRQVPVGGKKP